MKEFFFNDKLAFHLDVNVNALGPNITSNMPKELVLRAVSKVESRLIDSRVYDGTKQDFVEEVGALILKDKNSHYFYYPDYLLSVGNDRKGLLYGETKENIFTLGESGIYLQSGDYLSAQSDYLRFYVLSVHFQKIRLYLKPLFKNELISISREEYEKAIQKNGKAKSEYIELYGKENVFLRSDEKRFSLLFFLVDEILKAIVAIE